jgi:hypothetical protein
LGLTDTPASYAGQAGKLARVNTGETALEFVGGAPEMIILGCYASGGGTTLVSNYVGITGAGAASTFGAYCTVTLPNGTYIFIVQDMQNTNPIAIRKGATCATNPLGSPPPLVSFNVTVSAGPETWCMPKGINTGQMTVTQIYKTN